MDWEADCVCDAVNEGVHVMDCVGDSAWLLVSDPVILLVVVSLEVALDDCDADCVLLWV